MICNKCGNQLPDGSRFCDRCGNSFQAVQQQYQAPQPNQRPQYYQQPIPPSFIPPKKKKKWPIVLGVIVGLILIVALFGERKESDDTVNEPQEAAAQQDKSVVDETEDRAHNVGLNEAIELKNLKITALDIATSSGDGYFTPDDGNEFVGVQLEIENISGDDQTVSTLLLFDIYIDDVLSSYSISANVAFGDGTLDGTIAPGKKLIGWMAVESPIDASVIELHVKGSWLGREKAIFILDIPK